MNADKPQPGKVYSLYNLSKRGSTWSSAEVKQNGLLVGQVVSYYDQANPFQEAVVVEAHGQHGQKCIFMEDGHIGYVSSSFIGHTWKLVNRILSAPEVKAYQEFAILAAENKKLKQEQEAKRKDKERAELPNRYKHLEKTGKYSGRVLAARNIRTELKRAFPAVKFSVRSDSFSMGNSIDITWTDGPTSKQVEAITDKYESGSFDGMTDCYNYEGTPFKDVFGESKYVQQHRTISEKGFNKIVMALVEEYGIKDLPEWAEYKNGHANGTPMTHSDAYGRDSWQSLINRKSSEVSMD